MKPAYAAPSSGGRTVRTTSGRGVSGPPGTTWVHVDGVFVGAITRSSRRWARGFAVEYLDGRDLGDQPRLSDAVDSLVSFATSPLREARS